MTMQRSVTVRRTIAAAPADVFRAWTDLAHLDWFHSGHPGPLDPIEVDLRIGGAWRQTMIVDDDTRYVTGGIYRKIDPPSRLVFAWGAVGGWPALDPEHLDDAPQATVTLTAVDAGTDMVCELALPDHLTEDEVRGWFDLGIAHGWQVTVDRLVTTYSGAAAAAQG